MSDYEAKLTKQIAEYYDDPLGFVLFAFPWGEDGLEKPDEWQVKQLTDLGERIKKDPLGQIQNAIASGHGIGKTTEVAWIVLWAMSTRPHLAGWVTANTQTQLKSKTWRELSIWHQRLINKHWFVWTATRFAHAKFLNTWGIDAISWSEHNSEAFAGLHAKHVLMIMDEASSIADIIWEVAEGAMTTPRAIWLVYGNPTKNKGRFRECFGRLKHRWTTQQIDSRTCAMTDKKKIKEWVEDNGEDSDFVRIRVRGEFPKQSVDQLISSEFVEKSRDNDLHEEQYTHLPIAIGVDVARKGSNESVIAVRQGRKQLSQQAFNGLDNVELAMKVIETYKKHTDATIFVDEVGNGGGVVDTLKSLSYPVMGVIAGATFKTGTSDHKKFFNMKAKMWWGLKDWIESGADIVDDSALCQQMIEVEYSYTTLEKVVIDKHSNHAGSPDRAEALALTFAFPIYPKQIQSSPSPDQYGYDGVY